MLILWIDKYFIYISMTSLKVTKHHPILALTQPFPYWIVRWCFPLQIVWISLIKILKISLNRTLYLPFTILGLLKNRAERHDFKSRFLLFILLFFFLLFLGGKRKGKENNQSRDFKSCLSARSFWKERTHNMLYTGVCFCRTKKHLCKN